MGRKYSAFTLIELLIVIAFLAIMALIVINSLRSSIWRGNDAKRKSDLDRIRVAVEEYEKDHNCYPQIIYSNQIQCVTDVGMKPYLNPIPCDPVTKQGYYYEPDPGAPVCADWYRLYALLQYTADSSVIPKIGANASYNYYVKSPNAPVIPSPSGSSSPAPTSSSGPAVNYWGCINGTCQAVPLGPDGRPSCSPVFDNPQCSGNDCSSGGAPVCRNGRYAAP